MLVVAIGMIGATVMPHNLYLHSALVQSRKLQKDEPSIRQAIRFNTIDSVVALTVAFFVNAAILVLAAMVFYGKESVTVAGRPSRYVRPRERLDPRRLPDLGAASWDDSCQHLVCRGGFWPADRAARSLARWPGRW